MGDQQARNAQLLFETRHERLRRPLLQTDIQRPAQVEHQADAIVFERDATAADLLEPRQKMQQRIKRHQRLADQGASTSGGHRETAALLKRPLGCQLSRTGPNVTADDFARRGTADPTCDKVTTRAAITSIAIYPRRI